MKRLLVTVILLSLLSIWSGEVRLRCEEKAREFVVKTSDSVALFVRVKGKGMPYLYIHGGPGSGSHWAEKLSGDILERHFQMMYLDQRGVARSSSPRDRNYSMERMVKDFEEVRKALGITCWFTMGHSFGGILQMGYVRLFPEAMESPIGWLDRTITEACTFQQCSSGEAMSATFSSLRTGRIWKRHSANICQRTDPLCVDPGNAIPTGCCHEHQTVSLRPTAKQSPVGLGVHDTMPGDDILFKAHTLN